ncbi:hypothetical protein Lal_00022652 [Lupinus albus]|nr:hypothetical protein Lal_00022652 [Lupinus albus]
MGTTTNNSTFFWRKGCIIWRQILPVVPRDCRSDIVHATINVPYLWHQCTILTLTKNMHLQNHDNATYIRQFLEWILKMGDGKLSEPNDDYDNPIDVIVSRTYPNLQDQYKDEKFLQYKTIFVSTIEIVDQINDYVLHKISSNEKEYLSSDSVDMCDTNDSEAFNILTPEFLNSFETYGLPNHKIKLKVGTPIMFLRNLDQSERLCTGTRLMVTKMESHVLLAKIMSGQNIGNIIYIHRLSMSPSQSPWSFTLIRRQFPNCCICNDNQ